MLSLLRRSSASATTSLVSFSVCSRCISTVRTTSVQQFGAHKSISALSRPFHANAIYAQQAAAASAYENEVFEVDQQRNDSPSPENAGGENAQNGRVTKFADLAKRGLVCGTVVDTLTRTMGLETMTEVQSLTLNESLKGADM